MTSAIEHGPNCRPEHMSEPDWEGIRDCSECGLWEQDTECMKGESMPISDFDREHIGDIVAGSGDWFTAELLRLIAKADSNNRERLRSAFPEEVAAYEEWWSGDDPNEPIGGA